MEARPDRPYPRRGDSPGEQLRLLSPPEVEQHLRYVNHLLGSGHKEAAILLAWGSRRRKAAGARPPRGNPAAAPRHSHASPATGSLGLVDREQYRTLTDAYKARSAVAHGFRPQAELEPAIHAFGLSEELEAPRKRPSR